MINVASSAHYMSYPGEWILKEQEMHSPTKYQPWRAYGQSKLSNVLHARLVDLFPLLSFSLSLESTTTAV